MLQGNGLSGVALVGPVAGTPLGLCPVYLSGEAAADRVGAGVLPRHHVNRMFSVTALPRNVFRATPPLT